MKKKVFLVFLAFVCVFLSSCFADKKVKADENGRILVIEIDQNTDISKGETLIDYMRKLSEDGELSFELQGTMVVAFENIRNTTNSYWMLYTNDTENSNKEWGILAYKEKEYFSASIGASELIIKKGCIYIWNYMTF